MIKVIKHENMGRSDRGWLHSLFHFSFAEYYKPDNIKFGALRVVNDDRFDPHGGFGMHPHDNMEIISYVVDGQLTHRDSLGNGSRLERGDVQYMSAGSGIMHSEYNDTNEPPRFLQIWILPDEKNAEPNYGDHRFDWEDRVGKWMPVAVGRLDAHVLAHVAQDDGGVGAFRLGGERLRGGRPIAGFGREVLEVEPGRRERAERYGASADDEDGCYDEQRLFAARHELLLPARSGWHRCASA